MAGSHYSCLVQHADTTVSFTNSTKLIPNVNDDQTSIDTSISKENPSANCLKYSLVSYSSNGSNGLRSWIYDDCFLEACPLSPDINSCDSFEPVDSFAKNMMYRELGKLCGSKADGYALSKDHQLKFSSTYSRRLPSFENSFRLHFAPPVHRYCSMSYLVSHGNSDGEDYFIAEHVNGLLLTGMAPTHSFHRLLNCNYRGNVEVRFDFRKFVKESIASGKRKRGAFHVFPNTVIGDVMLDVNGSKKTFPVKACVTGDVIEHNAFLASDSSSLFSQDDADCWCIIVLPSKRQKVLKPTNLISIGEYTAMRQNITGTMPSRSSADVMPEVPGKKITETGNKNKDNVEIGAKLEERNVPFRNPLL